MAENCEGIEKCCDGTWFQYQPCPSPCTNPVVNAGDIQTKPQTGDPENPVTFDLDGTASDYDTLLWTQVSGPESSADDPESLTPTITTLDEPGEYVWNLAATNPCGTSNSQVSLIVTALGPFLFDLDYERILPPSAGYSYQPPGDFSLSNQSSYNSAVLQTFQTGPDSGVNVALQGGGSLVTITNYGVQGYLNFSDLANFVQVAVVTGITQVLASLEIVINGNVVSSVSATSFTDGDLPATPDPDSNIPIPPGITTIEVRTSQRRINASGASGDYFIQAGFKLHVTPDPV